MLRRTCGEWPHKVAATVGKFAFCGSYENVRKLPRLRAEFLYLREKPGSVWISEISLGEYQIFVVKFAPQFWSL